MPRPKNQNKKKENDKKKKDENSSFKLQRGQIYGVVSALIITIVMFGKVIIASIALSLIAGTAGKLLKRKEKRRTA
jgi:hypothetical protein